jgi:hypothetical protein
VSTFDADERSVSKSRPIDLYVFETPTVVYHLTSHIVDVDYAGQVYTAVTMDRESQEVAQDAANHENTVMLPITHPLVQSYAASGLPERQVLVTYSRLQARSGVAFMQWQGFATDLAADKSMASFRIPAITNDALKVTLPVIRAQRSCNHVLFDAQCTAPKAGFTLTKSDNEYLTNLSSQTIAVGSVTLVVPGWTRFGSTVVLPDGFFAFGEVHCGAEVRMCLSHIGFTITINAPFIGVSAGTALTMFPGCDHSVPTCLAKFNNVDNFGGVPLMNANFTPWKPGKGLSSIQQP